MNEELYNARGYYRIGKRAFKRDLANGVAIISRSATSKLWYASASGVDYGVSGRSSIRHRMELEWSARLRKGYKRPGNAMRFMDNKLRDHGLDRWR